ncbi:MAG: hypothetical protein Greene071436_369 [Parcubacteria group bacterium Greene0714_36]|nr:MAG: hypothetical protein Greene071436_369 [Parcubacteria group bacterium Greene0714_36]
MPRIFIAVILFIAAILLGVFYLRPEWGRFQGLKSDVAELEAISGEFDELIANRDHLLSLINSISKENLGRVDRLLPQGPHASDFLVSMEALTIQNAIALRRIDLVSPDADRSEAPAQPQAIGAAPGTPRPSGAASSPRAAKEVQTLPFNLQIAINVENISFSASGKGEISDFTLKAETYYQ